MLLSVQETTFVNRARLSDGEKCALQVNDIIQIGSVQLQLKGAEP
jgi:hypothetical protein